MSSTESAMALMRKGISNRTVAETSMNRCSSRSHCVFTISIQSTKVLDGVKRERKSLFHLIDLAGSERQKDTGTTGERLKEASQINKSLSALGNVIMSLVGNARNPHGRRRHVHYRDSKLTFLLKDSLGGNSLTCIVACCSPAPESVGETTSTLQFARRAKFIQNRAVINEDAHGSVSALQDTVAAQLQELSRLKAELYQTQRNSGKSMIKGALQNPHTPIRSRLPPSSTLHQTFVSSHNESGMLSDSELLKNALQQQKNWQNMLEKSRQETETAKAEAQQLKELVKKREMQHQSNKFVLKLRNAALKRAEARYGLNHGQMSENEVFETLQEMNNRLEEERDQYREQLEYNPELVQRTITIRELQNQVQTLKTQARPNKSSEKALLQHHALTQTIVELKSRMSEVQEKIQSPDVLFQALSTPQKRKFESFELEKWKQEQHFKTRMEEVEGLLESEQTAHLEVAEQLQESQNMVQHLMKELKHAQQQTLEAKEAAVVQASDAEVSRLKLEEQHKTNVAAIHQNYQHQFAEGAKVSGLEIAQAQSQIQELQTQLGNVQEELNQSKKAGKTAEVLAQTREVELHRVSGELDLLQHSSAQLNKKHETKITELSSRMKEVTKSLAETKEECEMWAHKHASETATHENTLELLERKELELQNTLVLLEEKVDALSKLNFSVDQLNQELDNVEYELSYKDEQYDALKQEMNELIVSSEAKTNDLNTSLNHHREMVTKIQGDLDRTSQEYSLLSQRKEQEASDGQKALKLVQDEVNVLNQQLSHSETSVQELEANILQYTEKNLALSTSLESTKATLEQEQAALLRNQQLLKTTEEKMETLQLKARQGRKTILSLGLRLSSSQKTCHSKDIALVSANSVIQEKTIQNESLITTCTNLTEQLSNLQNVNKEATNEIEQLVATNGQVKQEIKQVQNKNQELSLALTEQERVYTELMNRLAESEAQLESAQDINTEKDVEIKNNQIQMQDLQEKLVASQTITETFAENHRMARRELNDIRREKENDLKQADIREQTLNEEISNLKQQVFECQDILASIQNHLSQENVLMSAGLEQCNLAEQVGALRTLKSGALEDLMSTRASLITAEQKLEQVNMDLIEMTQDKVENDTKIIDMQQTMHQSIKERDENVLKLSNLDSQHTLVKNQLLTLQKDFSQERTQLLSRCEDLEGEITTLTENLEARNVSVENLQHAQKQTEQQLTEAKNAIQERHDLLATVNGMKDQVKNLESAVTEAVQNRDAAVEQVTELLEAKRVLTEAQTNLKNKYDVLRSETGVLTAENAKLVGHQNARQKIQYVAKIKAESDKLRQEKELLERELRLLRAGNDNKANSRNARDRLDQLTSSILKTDKPLRSSEETNKENMAPQLRSRSTRRGSADIRKGKGLAIKPREGVATRSRSRGTALRHI